MSGFVEFSMVPEVTEKPDMEIPYCFSCQIDVDMLTGEVLQAALQFRKPVSTGEYVNGVCSILHVSNKYQVLKMPDESNNQGIAIYKPITWQEYCDLPLTPIERRFVWNCIPCQFMTGDWT